MHPENVLILNEQTPRLPPISVTRHNYEAWRDRAQSFSAMAAFRPTSMTLTGGAEPERLPVKMITAKLLPILGVSIEDGGNFSDADDRAAAEGVAVVRGVRRSTISWRTPSDERCNSTSSPTPVVGVVADGFELFQAADIDLPLGPWAATLPDDRDWHAGIVPLARLKDGVSLEARTEMDGIARQLEAEFPDSNTDVRVVVNRAQDQLVQNVRPALLMLSGAVANSSRAPMLSGSASSSAPKLPRFRPPSRSSASWGT